MADNIFSSIIIIGNDTIPYHRGGEKKFRAWSRRRWPPHLILPGDVDGAWSLEADVGDMMMM